MTFGLGPSVALNTLSGPTPPAFQNQMFNSKAKQKESESNGQQGIWEMSFDLTFLVTEVLSDWDININWTEKYTQKQVRIMLLETQMLISNPCHKINPRSQTEGWDDLVWREDTGLSKPAASKRQKCPWVPCLFLVMMVLLTRQSPADRSNVLSTTVGWATKGKRKTSWSWEGKQAKCY